MLDPRTQKSEHLMQICQVERESARKRSANQRLEVEWGDDDVAGEIQKPHHKCTREKPKGIITVNKGDIACISPAKSNLKVPCLLASIQQHG